MIAINVIDVAQDATKHIVPKKHHERFGVSNSKADLPEPKHVDEYGNAKNTELEASIEMDVKEPELDV